MFAYQPYALTTKKCAAEAAHRKMHNPICCDTNFHFPNRYAKMGMHFYLNKNAHLSRKLFSLCRKIIIAQF